MTTTSMQVAMKGGPRQRALRAAWLNARTIYMLVRKGYRVTVNITARPATETKEDTDE